MSAKTRSGTARRITWAACLMAAATIGAGAKAGTYTGLVVFGDSLSDGGNVAAAVTAAGGAFPSYYADGRFSNGPVWVDYLAGMLGVADPGPSLLGGTNYAFGYAQTGAGFVNPAELGGAAIPNLGTQIQMFQASLGGTPMDSGNLVAIWAGANDILHGAVTDLAGVQAAVGNVIAGLGAVYDLGGRHFLVGGLPNLAGVPAAAGLSDADKIGLAHLSLGFNALLSGALANFRATHADARVAYHDVNSAFGALLSNPSAYGLTNLTDPALDAIAAGRNINPDEYLFWDTVHPTTAVHRIIARAAYNAVVPEPSSIALAAIGGVGVAIAAARRRAA